MAYFLTSKPENAVPGKSWVPPKTHTPGSRLEKRGQRYYFPEVGRWVSRDPIGSHGGDNYYTFLFNNTPFWIDYLGMDPMPHKGKATYDGYWDSWRKRNPDRDKSKDQNRQTSYRRGCVGVTCINTGKPGWPEQNSETKCFKNKIFMEAAARAMKCPCGKGVDGKAPKPVVFSIHLYNDYGIDPSKPDASIDGKTGEVDVSNWDHSAKPGYVNFDYGFINPQGYVEHANHFHGPAYENDPDATPEERETGKRTGSMEVYGTTPSDWHNYMHSDFNLELWCVTCNDEQH